MIVIFHMQICAAEFSARIDNVVVLSAMKPLKRWLSVARAHSTFGLDWDIEKCVRLRWVMIMQLLCRWQEYRIACNFRGAKFSWLEVWPRIFYPRMKRSCLPLPAVQAATTKILPTKCLNIAEPRIFCPPKITRYTVCPVISLLIITQLFLSYSLTLGLQCKKWLVPTNVGKSLF